MKKTNPNEEKVPLSVQVFLNKKGKQKCMR